ncbi:MAG TPA: hypothetical protein VHT97_08210 [Acidimicrobiales bacterium]|nr:hypothetical protein [Acidimicrobiales bacterium]
MSGRPPTNRLAELAAAIVLPVVALGYFTSTSGFLWDDFKNLRQAQVRGLSAGYLFAGTSGHFAPGHRLGDWFLERLFPFNFAAAEVILLLGFAVTLLLFHRLLAELYGPGPGPVVLTFLYGASIVHVGVIQWWSSGLDRVPATIFTFVSMIAYLRFFKTRSPRALAVSVGAMVLALLFYIKPVFIPLYLILLRVLLLEPERSLADTCRDAVREWRTWALYAAPVAVYLVIYVTYYKDAVSTPSVGVLWRYLSTLWLRVVGPGFFDLYLGKGSRSTATTAAIVLVQLVIVAGVVWTVARRRGSGRAWAFFALAFAANALVVGLTRIGTFSPETIAYTVYYNLEASYLFVLALGAVVLRWHPLGAPLPVRRIVPALVGACVAAYAVLGAFGAGELSSGGVWFGRQARNYEDRLQAGVARLPAPADGRAFVVDAVPNVVMPSFLAPYNVTSEVFPVIDDRFTFDVTGRPLYDVGPDGTPRPVTYTSAGGGDAVALLQAASLGVDPPTAAIVDGAVCVTSAAATTVIGFSPPAPITGGPLYAALRYSSQTQPLLAMATQPPGNGPPSTPEVVKLARGGDQTNLFSLHVDSLRALYLVLEAHSKLCIRRIEVGRVAPRAP